MNELFPYTKHVPGWLAGCFHKANAGNYAYKQLFYTDVKHRVLREYGEFAGHDKQVIERKCWSCHGTGVYKKYWYEGLYRILLSSEKCWNCNDGIYSCVTYYLERWVLNGKLYHIPVMDSGVFPYVNELKGVIKHEPVDNKEALKSFLVLLFYYNRKSFMAFVRERIRTKRAVDDLPF